jgi:membrane-associated phospholipid phosphatase
MKIIPHYFNIDLFFQFIKASELIMVYINLFIGIIYGSRSQLFLSIIIICNSYLNNFLKHMISVPVFANNNNSIPILGQGSRPVGASDCGYFTNCPNEPAKSFGFPSGHSQFAGLQTGFLIKDLLYNKSSDGKFKSLKSKDKISIVLLSLFVPIMMYSRVYIEKCHTIEQTIFGALVGLFVGYKSHGVYLYINKHYNNILDMDSPIKKIIISITFFFLMNSNY